MPNNYLLEEIDATILTNQINNIINNKHFQDATISTYDLEEVNIDDALEDLDTYGFLSSKKVIIIKNVFSNYDNKKFEKLVKYIDNSLADNLLFLVCKKLDNRLSIVKQLKKNSNLKLITYDVSAVQYVNSLLKNYKVSNKAINLLIDKCKNDVTKLRNECNKLSLYKIDSLEITEEDIEELVVKKLGESSDALFAFIRNLLLKNKKNALKSYQELTEYEVDIFSIIGLIGSQLRLIYQIKLLIEKKYTFEEIANKLNLKSTYQVKKLSEYSYDYSYIELAKLIKEIAELDYKIKSGRVDQNIALDMFILNL